MEASGFEEASRSEETSASASSDEAVSADFTQAPKTCVPALVVHKPNLWCVER